MDYEFLWFVEHKFKFNYAPKIWTAQQIKKILNDYQ